MKRLTITTLVVLLFGLFAGSALAQKHKVSAKKTGRGKTVASSKRRAEALHPRGWKPSLKGSVGSMVRQNKVADLEHLPRIKNGKQLKSMKRQGAVVAIPSTSAIKIDNKLDAERRFCRRCALRFLSDFSAAHYRKFKKPYKVSAAVRTIEYQARLGRHNGNAAKSSGPRAGSHPTAATLDISKNGMSAAEISFTRDYLLSAERADKIEVTEEFRQPCFHFMVFDEYCLRPSRKGLAKTRSSGRKRVARR